MCVKKLLMVEDLCDELDYENLMCIVIVLCLNCVDCDLLMNYLFVLMDLEKSFCVNLNMIGFDNCFQVKGLVQILSEWILFCCEMVCLCL